MKTHTAAEQASEEPLEASRGQSGTHPNCYMGSEVCQSYENRDLYSYKVDDNEGCGD